MKIKVKRTDEVEISIDEQKRIALQTIAAAAGWDPCLYANYTIKGDMLHMTQYIYTTHAFKDTIALRKATQLDYSTLDVIKNLIS